MPEPASTLKPEKKLPGRRTKSGSPRLSKRTILGAAIKIVKKQGLDKLTMRSLANELRVATMATYRHYRNRDDLIRDITDDLFRQRLKLKSPEGATWQEEIRRQGHHSLKVAENYPGVAKHIVQSGFNTPHGLQLVDRWIKFLLDAGFSIDDAVHAFQTVTLLNASFADLRADFDSKSPFQQMTSIDEKLLDASPYAKAALPVFSHSFDETLDWFLDRLIESLETRLKQK